jgi:hypothetical protein
MSIEELIERSKTLSQTAVKQELVNSLIVPFSAIVVSCFIILRILAYLFGWFNKKSQQDYEIDKQKYIMASLIVGAVMCGGYVLYERKLKVNTSS